MRPALVNGRTKPPTVALVGIREVMPGYHLSVHGGPVAENDFEETAGLSTLLGTRPT